MSDEVEMYVDAMVDDLRIAKKFFFFKFSKFSGNRFSKFSYDWLVIEKKISGKTLRYGAELSNGMVKSGGYKEIGKFDFPFPAGKCGK